MTTHTFINSQGRIVALREELLSNNAPCLPESAQREIAINQLITAFEEEAAELQEEVFFWQKVAVCSLIGFSFSLTFALFKLVSH